MSTKLSGKEKVKKTNKVKKTSHKVKSTNVESKNTNKEEKFSKSSSKSSKSASKSSKILNDKVSSYIYFDNNATTFPCNAAKKAHIDWISSCNASSDSRMAKPVKAMIENAADAFLAHCNVSSATHTIVFTSGATESNCFIIRSCVKSYKKKLIEANSNLKPHVIVSALEHHSIMECVKDLEETNDIDVSYISPTIYGNILSEDVEKEIRQNTCLISMMYANNEIPVLTNIGEIGEIAHKHRIPMHSDCVQIFGKYEIDIVKNNIDALSASGHKFYAPKGIGLLILSNALIEGYNLTAEISGSQQNGLRGGTENIAGIASMLAALKYTFINRKKKNSRLFKLRHYCLDKLSKHFKFNEFINYVYDDNNTEDNSDKADLELVSIGPPEDKKGFILPNCILLSVCKNKGRPFCNIDLKRYLDSKNIVVSIGSACLTKSESASHVLNAIGAPPVIKRGVIRISFSDTNNTSEINKFISVFIQGVMKQCYDINIEKPVKGSHQNKEENEESTYKNSHKENIEKEVNTKQNKELNEELNKELNKNVSKNYNKHHTNDVDSDIDDVDDESDSSNNS